MDKTITEEQLAEWEAKLSKIYPVGWQLNVEVLIVEVRRQREENKQLGREVVRLEVCCRRQREEIDRLKSGPQDFRQIWERGL